MTSVLMLARLRTLLDESAAGFWTDTEAYAALSDGQREVFNVVFKRDPHSQTLKNLLRDTADGTAASNQAITLPTDFREFVVAKLAVTTTETKKPCRVIDYNESHFQNQQNTYLAPNKANPVVYVKGTTALGKKIYFEPSSASSDYSITYITQPTEISAAVEPVLPVDAQEPIIIYAFSFLLRKDLRAQEADGAYKIFSDMVGKL